MRPEIDDELKERIAEVVAYADKNPYSLLTLLEISSGLRLPVDDINRRLVQTKFGYRMMYGIEENFPGMCRHLSVSSDVPNTLPDVEIVEELMKLYGFPSPLWRCSQVTINQTTETRAAFNIIDLIKE